MRLRMEKKIRMDVHEVPLAELKLPDYLHREHTPEQLDRCKKSIGLYGQYQPLVVSNGEILCGTLVFQAMRELGMESACVNDIGWVSDRVKREIRYLDNQIFDIEDWDVDKLKRYLMTLEDDDAGNIAFSPDEVEMIVNGLETLSLAGGGGLELEDQWQCDSCGWTGVLPRK